jgi:hypothetical protein
MYLDDTHKGRGVFCELLRLISVLRRSPAGKYS